MLVRQLHLPKDLSGVEDAVGVEGGFDGAHDVDGCAVLLAKGVDFAEADAVLAGAGTAHGQGALEQILIEALGCGDFFGMLFVEDEEDVEVASNGLAHGLAAVISLFAPELIVVGGGLGGGNPDYLAIVERRTRPLITPYFRDCWRMAVSELGERVVAQGAAVLAATDPASRVRLGRTQTRATTDSSQNSTHRNALLPEQLD